MIELSKISEFEDYLQNEFSKLGFNYQEIKANGIKNADKGRYEMSVIDPLDDSFLYADCFGIDFIVINSANERQAVIETMNAVLYCQIGYDEYIPLINKTYSANEGALPAKDQIIAEIKELLRINNSRRIFDQNSSQDTIIGSELDEHLKNTFSKLGFNYQEIKANGTKNLGNSRVEMFFVDYFSTPHPLADGLAFIFTVGIRGSDQDPTMEAMQVTLFNDSLYGNFTPLIEKKYLSEKNGLPDKEEVSGELSSLLKLKQQADKGLTNEFARLGFDLKDLLNSAERVGEHEIFLSKTVESDLRLEPGSKVKFTFSVTNSPSEQMYCIEHLTAVMRRSISNSEDRVLFENDYLRKDAPLPTMEEIFDQIAESEKRKEIREKFGLAGKNLTSHVKQKKVTNRKMM